MDNFQFYILLYIISLLGILLISVLLFYVVRFLFNKFKSASFLKSSRFFNPSEYLPSEEVLTLKQVFYLIMILVIVNDILYLLYNDAGDLNHLKILDILISYFIAVHIDMNSLKDKILFILLIPFSSISFLIFGFDLLLIFDLLHAVGLVYFIKVYYDKFVEYTETNSLGITIILLFSIIFISFFVTLIVEDVSPLDSIVMVSNAFTSNGYAILGHTGFGKVNSLVLVWGGFLLSSVGSATLCVSIVMKHIDNKFDKLEESVKKNKKN